MMNTSNALTNIRSIMFVDVIKEATLQFSTATLTSMKLYTEQNDVHNSLQWTDATDPHQSRR